MNITLNVKPVEKLITSVRYAIGKVYEPYHIRRKADANAYEIKTIGEALRETSDIPSGYKVNGISMDTSDLNELEKRAKLRSSHQELIKEYNIESVVGKAYKQLEGMPLVPDEPVDQDWLLRFFNSVEDISNEQLQGIWSKILAGEINRSKSFSLRTLATLHNLSQDEAILFQNISQYLVVGSDNNYFIPYYLIYSDGHSQKIYEECHITYKDILVLTECNLINSSPLSSDVDITSEEICVARNKNIGMFASAESGSSQIYIEAYLLTNTGRELANLFADKANDEYFIGYIKFMNWKFGGTKISGYHISLNNDDIVKSDAIDLALKEEKK